VRPLSRVVVFVGAFDPMHSAHVQKATAAAAMIRGTCLLMPVSSIPHKPKAADIGVRMEIMKAQTDGLPNLIVIEETVELHSENYMFQLAQESGDRVFSLLGRDSFNSIRALSCAGSILNHTTVIVAARGGYELDEVGRVAEGIATYESGGPPDPSLDLSDPRTRMLEVWQNRTSPPHQLLHVILGHRTRSSAKLRAALAVSGDVGLGNFTHEAAALVRAHYRREPGDRAR